MNPFTPDGHLHDLGLELHLGGALGAHEPAAREHLAHCNACAARVAAAREVVAPAPRGAAPVVLPVAANQSLARWVVLAVAVAAAVALVVRTGRPPVDGDDLRVKGSSLRVEVFREAGERAERLREGDAVYAGDHLGFRVHAGRSGHLLVAGTDGGAPYLCYPQASGGRSAPFPQSAAPVDLQEAVRMDAALGEERLVAILCTEPFHLDELPAPLGAALPPGCVADTVRLIKVAR